MRYAHRDADEFYKLITSLNGGGFKPEHICKLTNEAATTSNIQRAFRSFLKKPSREDLVVVYLACHGTPDPEIPKNLYLVAHDTDPDDISGTALPMRDIIDSLQNILRANNVIVFSDVGHSSALMEDFNGKEFLNNYYPGKSNHSSEGKALLISAEADEGCLEDVKWGGGHGVFTYYLLKGMRGAADKDQNGIVTVGELFDYVIDNVQKETNYRQHPTKGTNKFDQNLPVTFTGFNNHREDDQKNLDVTLEVSLTKNEMTIGTKKNIFAGRENIVVTIPGGVKPGKKIRVKGKGGVSKEFDQRGDLYLIVVQSNEKEEVPGLFHSKNALEGI